MMQYQVIAELRTGRTIALILIFSHTVRFGELYENKNADLTTNFSSIFHIGSFRSFLRKCSIHYDASIFVK
jgi:hypothetical protein